MPNMILRDEQHINAMKEYADSFQQFIRNGVWGTCADCPRDNNNKAYPEFCKYGHRGDHHLSFSDLAYSYETWMKNSKKSKPLEKAPDAPI